MYSLFSQYRHHGENNTSHLPTHERLCIIKHHWQQNVNLLYMKPLKKASEKARSRRRATNAAELERLYNVIYRQSRAKILNYLQSVRIWTSNEILCVRFVYNVYFTDYQWKGAIAKKYVHVYGMEMGQKCKWIHDIYALMIYSWVRYTHEKRVQVDQKKVVHALGVYCEWRAGLSRIDILISSE